MALPRISPVRQSTDRSPPAQAGNSPTPVVKAIRHWINAIAEGGGLDFGGGSVVGDADEIDAPFPRVEDGALGELVAALARGVHRPGIDEVDELLHQVGGRGGIDVAH